MSALKNYRIILILVLAILSSLFFLLMRQTSKTTEKKISNATKTQAIYLNDGDSYTIVADNIVKEINGKKEKMLAYNGSIPGPTLYVKQGTALKVLFKNNTDIENTIHMHGVRMENAFDGVPSVTQPIVKKGESFEYVLRFPDAGIFWYHPHNRDDFNIEHGLYGAIVVAPKGENSWNEVSREETIFIDDILISTSGIASFQKDFATYALMGRFGNMPFLNGKTQFVTTAKKGEVIRYYLINSANTRPFKIAFSGAKMKLVGGDNGLYEKDLFVDDIVLHPSERAIVEVLFVDPGEHNIVNRASRALMKLGAVSVTDGNTDDTLYNSFTTLSEHPEVTASFERARELASTPPDKKVALTLMMKGDLPNGGMGHGGMMNHTITEEGIEWDDTMPMMNEMSDSRNIEWKIVDEENGNENMDIAWNFKRGVPVKIRITNDIKSAHPMQHPIHFHGVRFVVVNKNGISQDNLVWKDTVGIPAGEYVDIVMIPENPGVWMVHCHILEHIEAGMMMSFIVNK